jgi:hypothetical protein
VKKPSKPVMRSDDQVRGRKNLWRVFITVNPGNSIVYWLAGRK